jgi:HSP20 family protein
MAWARTPGGAARRDQGARLKIRISAQHKQELSSNNGTYLRRELTYGSYARSIQLPGDVSQNDIKASFDNGILTIEIPKLPAPKPVKIQITGKSQKQFVGAGAQK